MYWLTAQPPAAATINDRIISHTSAGESGAAPAPPPPWATGNAIALGPWGASAGRWPLPLGPERCPADVWRGSRIEAVFGRVVMRSLSCAPATVPPGSSHAWDSRPFRRRRVGRLRLLLVGYCWA